MLDHSEISKIFIKVVLHSRKKSWMDRENTPSRGCIIKCFWNWAGKSLFNLGWTGKSLFNTRSTLRCNPVRSYSSCSVNFFTIKSLLESPSHKAWYSTLMQYYLKPDYIFCSRKRSAEGKKIVSIAEKSDILIISTKSPFVPFCNAFPQTANSAEWWFF